MTSQPSIPRTVDELSPERRTNCFTFLGMRSDLKYLENRSGEPLDSKRVAEINRRLIAELLQYAESKILTEELKLTEFELAYSKKYGALTEVTRRKLRDYVDDFLRKKIKLIESELIRLRECGAMTEETRLKLRVYVDDFLRDNLGI